MAILWIATFYFCTCFFLPVAPLNSDNEASISVEYHGRNSRHKRSVVGQQEPLTLEERHQLQRLYGNQFNLEAAETVKAMGMAENGHWIPPHHQNLRRERRFQPSRWSIENKNYDNRRQMNSPIYNYQDEEQQQLHQAEQEEVDERHLELEQGTFPMPNDNNNNKLPRTQNKVNNNNNIISKAKSKPKLEVLLKSLLEKLQESKSEGNPVHEKESPPKIKNVNNNAPNNRKIRHAGPSSNTIMETEEEKDAEEECSLYGTWLSPLAGVAIILHPVRQTITVTLENLPGVKNPLVSKSWIGTAMISPISPTTLTLIFQEGQLTTEQSIDESPETAIFVGQCIYCRGGTAIQGSWTIFTRKRNCLPSSVITNVTGHYGNSEFLYRKSL